MDSSTQVGTGSNNMLSTYGSTSISLMPQSGNKALTKIAAVMKECGWISKDNVVDMGKTKYSYVSEVQYIAELRPLFLKHGLVMLPSSVRDVTTIEKVSNNSTSYLMSAVFGYTFYDVESGDSLCVEMLGQGIDSMDKGAYKLATGAFKYALRQTFMIGSGDDPEATDDQGNEVSYAAPKRTKTSQIDKGKRMVLDAFSLPNVKPSDFASLWKKHKISFSDLPDDIDLLKNMHGLAVAVDNGEDVSKAIAQFEANLKASS